MSTLVVIQARTGSSRFPGKVLAELADQTMLGFMLDRIAPLAEDPATTIVVATSDSPDDDDVAEVARSKQVAAVRGSEADVLGRFQLALDEHPADDVVRLTADCPLMDPEVVRSVLAIHRTSGADYTSNTLARTFPDGLDVEVMSAGALVWASEHAEQPDEREHVTPFIQRHPRTFQLAQHTDDALAGDERWTVDTRDDLSNVRDAVNSATDPLSVSWRQLLDLVGRRPRADVTVVPVALDPHRRGEPYHRQWMVGGSIDHFGSGAVVVEDGGTGTLTIRGERPREIESVVRERLQADLQVTDLTLDMRAST